MKITPEHLERLSSLDHFIAAEAVAITGTTIEKVTTLLAKRKGYSLVRVSRSIPYTFRLVKKYKDHASKPASSAAHREMADSTASTIAKLDAMISELRIVEAYHRKRESELAADDEAEAK